MTMKKSTEVCRATQSPSPTSKAQKRHTVTVNCGCLRKFLSASLSSQMGKLEFGDTFPDLDLSFVIQSRIRIFNFFR